MLGSHEISEKSCLNKIFSFFFFKNPGDMTWEIDCFQPDKLPSWPIQEALFQVKHVKHMPLKNRTSSLHYNIFTGYFCIAGFLLAIPLAYYYNYIWYPNLLKSKGREPHPFGEGHCKLQKN